MTDTRCNFFGPQFGLKIRGGGGHGCATALASVKAKLSNMKYISYFLVMR